MAAPVRFGLIGTGYWARTTHAAGLVEVPGAELVGVWGRNERRAAELADEVGARAYADFDAMLVDVDALTFAVPPDVQAAMGVHAARAGRHLLLEKPVATSVAAAAQLEQAVSDAGVASLVFVTARYTPELRAWRDEVHRQGGWKGGWGRWIAGALNEGSPYAESAWRWDRGALWDVGPHAIAALSAGLGDVASVQAVAGEGDLVHLVLTHVGGATSTATMTLRAPAEAAHTEVTIWGEHGRSTLPLGETSPVAAYRQAASELVELARSGRRGHPCDVRAGFRTVELLADAEQQLGGDGSER